MKLFIALFMMTFVSLSSMAEEEKIEFKDMKALNPEFQKLWSDKEGIITGGDGETKVPKNTFLCTKKEYSDFELTCLFRITGDHKTGLINSGIQYRSLIKGKKIVGYQADIGKKYWGDLYDEHRRGLLKKGDLKILNKILKPEGWNSYIIRCKGKQHTLYINGVKTVEYTEEKDVPHKGVIGFQLHSGGKAKIEFQDIKIKILK